MKPPRNEWLELLATTLDWVTDDHSLVFVDATYTYSSAHNRLDDVTGGARIITVALTGKTVTGPVLTADDLLAITDPSPPNTLVGAWLFSDTGVEATSVLARFIDHMADGTPMDFTTDVRPFGVEFPDLGLVKI